MVTDSTADLPPSWGQRYGIEVVPLRVLFGEESFRDRVDLDEAEFFARLSKARRLPTTSAPSPGDFAAVYERLGRDCDGVISIHIGAQLSGTVEAARLGAESVPGLRVEVVDTRSVTMCVGFLCRLAAEAPSLDQALALVGERLPKLGIIALLDTLRYIEMGGRVGRAQAFLGTVLDLKPILGVSDGVISPLDRVRTRSRGTERILSLLLEAAPLEQVAVMHGNAQAEAEELGRRIESVLPALEVQVAALGTVLATHTGPGALGLAYIKS